MTRGSTVPAFLLGISLLPDVSAQEPTFTLSFDPCPSVLEVPAGEEFQRELYAVLTTTDNASEEGAQAWSISLSADGMDIVDITTQGTVAARVDDDPPGLREERGFERTVLTASGWSACEGRKGAVSAVLLSRLGNLTLPPRGGARIARIVVRGQAPALAGESAPASILFLDGCMPNPEPTDNTVTWQETAVKPILGRCDLVVKATRQEFRRGDANDDGKVDLSDPVAVLSVKFHGTGRLPCRDSADANDDGSVDLTDAISLLSYLFLGSYSPRPPGPAACGPDPTPDSLPACESASCAVQ